MGMGFTGFSWDIRWLPSGHSLTFFMEDCELLDGFLRIYDGASLFVIFHTTVLDYQSLSMGTLKTHGEKHMLDNARHFQISEGIVWLWRPQAAKAVMPKNGEKSRPWPHGWDPACLAMAEWIKDLAQCSDQNECCVSPFPSWPSNSDRRIAEEMKGKHPTEGKGEQLPQPRAS